MKDMGKLFKMGRPPIPDKVKAKIIRLAKKGKTQAEIAAETGVSTTTISKVAREYAESQKEAS